MEPARRPEFKYTRSFQRTLQNLELEAKIGCFRKVLKTQISGIVRIFWDCTFEPPESDA